VQRPKGKSDLAALKSLQELQELTISYTVGRLLRRDARTFGACRCCCCCCCPRTCH